MAAKCLKLLFVGWGIWLTTTSCSSVPSATPHETVEVVVFNAMDHSLIPGAQVFVLGSDGRELVRAAVDQGGRATVSVPLGSHGPIMVLAEAPAFFIGGLRWSNGARERLIELVPIAVF